MQVFQTEDQYILQSGDYTLWCSRVDGKLEAKRGFDLCSAWNPVCIGLVHGLIGKIKIHQEADYRLLLVSRRTLVGTIAKQDIYQINRIAILPLSNAEPGELDLELCKMHHFGIKKPARITQQSEGQQNPLQKMGKQLKTAAENVKPKKKEVKDRDKFVKRVLDELMKMYNDSDSFYYSDTYDLTNSIQKQHGPDYDKSMPLYQRVNERFFWNKHMLQDLFDVSPKSEEAELAGHWIVPVIQGYVQIEHCLMDFLEDKKAGLSDSVLLNTDFGNPNHGDPLKFNIGILSRRSRHRAGTRSKKRGIDETGACANYVETEQVLEFETHLVSFVQVRGSIPVYWSQTGYKYRPPPKLDRGQFNSLAGRWESSCKCGSQPAGHFTTLLQENPVSSQVSDEGDKENQEAFVKHFDEELSVYKSIEAINLAELVGKEKAISDAYLNNILEYNSSDITYIMFDFHEYCRGMKFENVSILTDGISDIIRKMRYCWVDRKGMICDQMGVFRVNCVDCLDRTNVVQTAIARIVMETQCRKLGILPPDETFPHSCKRTFQQLWANNGDAISRQYAGTAALKGDYTRTGSRKLTGLMKDGVYSANRYYLRFKDNYRQAAIDLTLGQPVTHELLMMTSTKLDQQEEDLSELLEKEENLKMLIEDCKKMIIVEPEQCLGGWSLIDADPITGDPDRQDMDTILLLSQRAVYVAWYDDEEEEFVQYQRIFLEDIELIEIGAEPAIFKSKFICLRLHYRHYAEEGFFHTFRNPSTRLFNNIVIAIKNMEEARESLKAIYQGFSAAREILSLQLQLDDRSKLDRKKTRPHPEIQDIHQQQQENALAGIHVPRDISVSDLGKLKLRGRESPGGQRSGKSSPGSASPNITESPKSSPSSQRKRNLFSAFDISNIKKNINSGLKIITVPKIELQKVNLMRRVKSQKSKKEVEKSKWHISADDLTDTDNLERLQTEKEAKVEEKMKARPPLVKRYSKDDIDVKGLLTESESGESMVMASASIEKEKDFKVISQDKDLDLESKSSESIESSVELNLPGSLSGELDSEEREGQGQGQSLEKGGHQGQGQGNLYDTESNDKDRDLHVSDKEYFEIDEKEVDKLPVLKSGKDDKKNELSASQDSLDTQKYSTVYVPRIVHPGSKTRKTQRIMETLEQIVQDKFQSKELHTKIIYL